MILLKKIIIFYLDLYTKNLATLEFIEIYKLIVHEISCYG